MPISDVEKLARYNGALFRLGSRRIASLTENREPRRVLDSVWGVDDDIITYALERAEWNFALRTVQGDYNSAIEPGFGFSRAYDKPTDFCRLAALSSNEYLKPPLTNDQYLDEAGYWFTDSDVLYVRYVSSSADYGFNSEAWTQAFNDYVECRMAWLACERITNSTSKEDRLERKMNKALKVAKSNDAGNEGVKFPPNGSWIKSRRGGR